MVNKIKEFIKTQWTRFTEYMKELLSDSDGREAFVMFVILAIFVGLPVLAFVLFIFVIALPFSIVAFGIIIALVIAGLFIKRWIDKGTIR